MLDDDINQTDERINDIVKESCKVFFDSATEVGVFKPCGHSGTSR